MSSEFRERGQGGGIRIVGFRGVSTSTIMSSLSFTRIPEVQSCDQDSRTSQGRARSDTGVLKQKPSCRVTGDKTRNKQIDRDTDGQDSEWLPCQELCPLLTANELSLLPVNTVLAHTRLKSILTSQRINLSRPQI